MSPRLALPVARGKTLATLRAADFGRRLLASLAVLVSLVGCGDGASRPEGDPVVDPVAGPTADTTERPRLVILGLDGLSWNLLDPQLELGRLPHFSALVERGLSGELETVEPLLSPPNWVSLATGRRPEVHGIDHFFSDRRAIRVPTIWNHLAAAGRRVGLYDVLVTWPPRPLPGGFVVPSWLRRDDRVHPEDLWRAAAIEPYAYEVVDVGGIDATLEALDRELTLKGPTFARLVETFDPHVAMVVFYAVDVANHVLAHSVTVGPAPAAERARELPPLAERHRGALDRILVELDTALGRLVDRLGPETNLVLVSDHGSGLAEERKRYWGWDVPWLLARAGLEDEGITTISGFLSASFACPDVATAGALAAFLESVTTPADESLFEVTLHRADDPASERARLPPWQLEMIEGHPTAAAHVFAAGRPSLLDRLWPDGEVVVAGGTVALERLATPHDFTGDHLRQGFFLAAGPVIARRGERIRLSILDVTPLLYHLAGLPIPDDLEGAMDPSWLTTEALAAEPPRMVRAGSLPVLDETTSETDESAAGDEAIRKRLEALGYVG